MPTCDMSVLTMLYNTDTCAIHLHTSEFSWRRSVVACVVRRMNEVTLRRARLVLGWATVFGRVQPSRYVTSQLGQLSLASLQDKLPRRKYHACCCQINHCLLWFCTILDIMNLSVVCCVDRPYVVRLNYLTHHDTVTRVLGRTDDRRPLTTTPPPECVPGM